MSDNTENNLEQRVIALLEQSMAMGAQMREWQAALREGKKLPVSDKPIDWLSLKARLAVLTNIDEDTYRMLEEAFHITNQENPQQLD